MTDRKIDARNDAGDELSSMPRWTWRVVAVFWLGWIIARWAEGALSSLADLFLIILVSLFLALAIEPGVNRLAARGWRRGTATALILFTVILAFLVFIAAMGTLVAGQIADLLGNSERYVTRTVDFLNSNFDTKIDPKDVIQEIQDPNGRIQQFITSQGDRALKLSVTALGVLFQGLTVMLFTFYLVADGPKLRRAICSRLRPGRQRQVLDGWELAIDKTGGYLYSRALLAGLSAVFHWIVFQAVGTQAPVALALWVGFISQFLPVVGTYLAGVLPLLVTLLDSPVKALVVGIAIVLYQQVENYVFAPRITARTMELHPALAFGAAIGGGALLGGVGAVLALPAAAMIQALASGAGVRYEVIDSHLTKLPTPRVARIPGERRFRLTRRGDPGSRDGGDGAP